MGKEEDSLNKRGDILTNKTVRRGGARLFNISYSSGVFLGKKRDLPTPDKGNTDDFMNRFNQLPSEKQSVIASYSSFFMEEDIYKKYLIDRDKLEDLRRQLREFGLEDNEVSIAMKVFGFPENPEANNK